MGCCGRLECRSCGEPGKGPSLDLIGELAAELRESLKIDVSDAEPSVYTVGLALGVTVRDIGLDPDGVGDDAAVARRANHERLCEMAGVDGLPHAKIVGIGLAFQYTGLSPENYEETRYKSLPRGAAPRG